MRQRFRLGLAGKLFGFLPICWTLIARDVSGAELIAAQYICDNYNGLPVKGEKYFTGMVVATLKGE